MNGSGDIPISSTNGTTTASIRPCGLTSIIPTLGMSCRGRAEAFARRLQSKLRTLGSQNDEDSPTNEDNPILVNGISGNNTWLTHTEPNNQVLVTSIQPSLLRHSNNYQQQQAETTGTTNSTSDSFYDFDCDLDEIESPGSPIDECEYSRLIETTSNTPPHDCAIESGCICSTTSSSITSTNGGGGSSGSAGTGTGTGIGNDNNSRASSQSSDGPYFDPVSSDSGGELLPSQIRSHHKSNNPINTQVIPIVNNRTTTSTSQDILSRTPTDFYDCLEINKLNQFTNMTNMELDNRKNLHNITNGHYYGNNHYSNNHHYQQQQQQLQPQQQQQNLLDYDSNQQQLSTPQDEVDHHQPEQQQQNHHHIINNEHIHMNGGDNLLINKLNNIINNYDSSCDSLSADSLPPSQDSSSCTNTNTNAITTTTTAAATTSSSSSSLNGLVVNNSISLNNGLSTSVNTLQDVVLNELQLISNNITTDNDEDQQQQQQQQKQQHPNQTECENNTKIMILNENYHHLNNDDIEEPPLSPIDDHHFHSTDNNNEQLQKLKTQIDAAVDAVLASSIQQEQEKAIKQMDNDNKDESLIITNDEQMLIANKHTDDINNKQHLCDTDEEDDCRPQRVRRCSSLKTGKTPPGTPGRKKIVRFADVLGLDLADVKTFLDEIPNVPISAYQDLEVIETEPPIQLGPKADRILMPLFQQPGSLPSFLDIVRIKQVNLENATITDHLNLTINGSVRVRNLDFHKSVHIRYTTDNWRTFTDISTIYVSNSCDGFSDKFIFTLCCNRLMVGQRLEFAVRFQCKGQQYWDNNYGSNYCFQCLPSTTPAPLLSSASTPSILPSTNHHIRPINLQSTNLLHHNNHHSNHHHQQQHNHHHHHTNNHMLSPSAAAGTNDAWCVSFY